MARQYIVGAFPAALFVNETATRQYILPGIFINETTRPFGTQVTALPPAQPSYWPAITAQIFVNRLGLFAPAPTPFIARSTELPPVGGSPWAAIMSQAGVKGSAPLYIPSPAVSADEYIIFARRKGRR